MLYVTEHLNRWTHLPSVISANTFSHTLNIIKWTQKLKFCRHTRSCLTFLCGTQKKMFWKTYQVFVFHIIWVTILLFLPCTKSEVQLLWPTFSISSFSHLYWPEFMWCVHYLLPRFMFVSFIFMHTAKVFIK